MEINRQHGECDDESGPARRAVIRQPRQAEDAESRQACVEKIPRVRIHKGGMVSHRPGPGEPSDGRPASSSRAPAGRLYLVAVLALALLAGCGRGGGSKKIKLPPPIKNPRIGWTQTGVASWYGHPYHGRKTSNGETYDMEKMTAAHKRLPFDTWLNVKNLSNGQATQVRINDRGPFVGKRIIDLSRAAASDIGLIASGTARVRLTVVRPPGNANSRNRGRGAGRRERAFPRQSGKFDIQIGVFAKRSNAEALASRAKRRGHQATIEPFDQGGASRFRVVVAGGARGQANSRLNRLKRQGFDGFIKAR